MANINLNNYFRKSTNTKSNVDSRIKLNKSTKAKEYYGDILFDLDTNELKERPLNAKESTRDLKRIVNEESVITALRNIFNTHHGSRLLNPEVAFDIKQYLFEPLTQTKAWFLGYDICQTLPIYEPRVTIDGVVVDVHANEGCYTIQLSVRIPSLNKSIKISSILSQEGYSILG